MRWITQTLAVLALNIRTIPQRLSSSAVAIIGIAGVVVVFVSVLSIAAGFPPRCRDRALPIARSSCAAGADSEMTSGLSGADVDVIKQAPGIRRDGQTPLAAAELIVIIDLPKVERRRTRRPTCRCAASAPRAFRSAIEFSIVEGRMFEVRHK